MDTPRNLTGQIKVLDVAPSAFGGFSAVRRAFWRPVGSNIDIDVAFKVLKAPGNLDRKRTEARLFRRLYREANVWKDLCHDCVVPFLGFAVGLEGPGLISPYYPRGHLRHFLSRHSTANREVLCYDVARGLDYLHSRNIVIVHGDIKCENVLIDAEGRACLCDFGLSLKEDLNPTGHSTSDFGGSLRYMAPELLETSSRSPKSDVYAFGCLCLEVLYDAIPFPNIHRIGQLMRAITGGHPPYVFGPSDPLILFRKSLIANCWRSEVKDRPSIRALRDAFRCSLLEHRNKVNALATSFETEPSIEYELENSEGSTIFAIVARVGKTRSLVRFQTLEPKPQIIEVLPLSRVEWTFERLSKISSQPQSYVGSFPNSLSSTPPSLLSLSRPAANSTLSHGWESLSWVPDPDSATLDFLIAPFRCGVVVPNTEIPTKRSDLGLRSYVGSSGVPISYGLLSSSYRSQEDDKDEDEGEDATPPLTWGSSLFSGARTDSPAIRTLLAHLKNIDSPRSSTLDPTISSSSGTAAEDVASHVMPINVKSRRKQPLFESYEYNVPIHDQEEGSDTFYFEGNITFPEPPNPSQADVATMHPRGMSSHSALWENRYRSEGIRRPQPTARSNAGQALPRQTCPLSIVSPKMSAAALSNTNGQATLSPAAPSNRTSLTTSVDRSLRALFSALDSSDGG